MSRSRAATPAGKRRRAQSKGASHKTSTRRPRKHAARSAPPRKKTPRKPASRKPARRKPAARNPSARPAWRYRLLALAFVLVAAGAGYWFWLRDSSLVAISDVEVAGVTGPEGREVAQDLTRAAEGMTTLHVDHARLEGVASRYPTVEAISADANFPHGLRIEVSERTPRMLVRVGEDEVPVAGDGTVLAGVDVSKESLPAIDVDEVPPGGVLGGEPLEQARVAGAAPEELHPLIEKLRHSDDHGVEVVLRGGIELRFGTGAAAEDKWAAAAALLADPDLVSATYIDVQVPTRPVAGGQPAETAAAL
jgi:cell division protein FtsQ